MAREPGERIERDQLSEDQIREENRAVERLAGDGDEIGNGDDIETRKPGEDDGGAGAGDEVEKRKPLRPGKFHDKRAEIAEKAKQLRDERNDPDLAGQIAVDRERMFGRNVAQPDLPADDAGGDDQPAAKRKLKVNGQEIELDENQIIEHAQKHLAAEGILEDVKKQREEVGSLLQQLREAKAAGDTNQPAAVDPKAKTPDARDTNARNEEMDKIIDDIQVGDRKDAVAALQKFGDGLIERVAEKFGSLDDVVASRVDEVNRSNERKRQTADVLETFATENSDFAKSRKLQSVLAQEAADTMRASMKAIGVKDETYASLMAERNFTDIEATSFAYRTLIENGAELPAHIDVLKSSAEAIRKEFGLVRETPARKERTERSERKPDNSNFTQDRDQRKRVMNPQPRRANIVSAAETQERSIMESRRAAVAQMKAHRRGGRS